MPYDGYEPIKIEKFGGLNTLIDPTNLPIFASPDCQDVEFIYGLVRTRPGITQQFPPIINNPTVNYLKTYITNAEAIRMLALDSLGNLWKENPQGTLGIAGTIENTGVYANSVSLFGREYLAIGDGKFGTSIPRQFDDVNFDRVSQEGPGQGPVAQDETASLNIQGAVMFGAMAIDAAGLTQSGSLVTLTFGNTFSFVGYLPSGGGPQIGDKFQVAGAGVAGYNGTWTVVGVLNGYTVQFYASTTGLAPSGGGTIQFAYAAVTFTALQTATNNIPIGVNAIVSGATVAGYNGTWRTVEGYPGTVAFIVVNIGQFGLAASGTAGTVTVSGNVVSGIHQVSVVFVTRQGYLTRPAPPTKWQAAGGKRVVLGNIPTGPPDIIARILLFTASGGSSFFYLPQANPSVPTSYTVINDNGTTQVTVDFSDTLLLGGTPADNLFTLYMLGECSGVTQYSKRLFWWGERKKDTNGGDFLNLSFDGGFSNFGSSPNFPQGWTPDTAFGAGGGSAVVNGQPVVWTDAYYIAGNGVAATRGLITQTGYQDFLGNPILLLNTQYSVRARIRGNRALTQGAIHVNLFSASAGINTTGLVLIAAQTTTTYTEYIAVLGGPFTTVPFDLTLRIYVDGTPINGDAWMIDNVEVFPTAQPYNVTTVRASFVEQPEAYDGVTGLLDVAPANGQAVRSAFVIRNNLYFVKERSLFVTQDDGTNEPNQWSIQEVSTKVGTLSVRGVGLGDEWAIIAGQSGAYYFDGGEPQKLSQEIQPTWDQINWAYGHLIDVKVDTQRKRVYIDVPFGTSTVNNKKLTLDYTDGFGDPNPTNTVNIAGIGRKWVPWTGNVAGNSQNFILRADGTQPLFIGNGAGNGKIYGLDLTGTVFTDDGAKINDYWQSGYFQDEGRLDFGYLTANVVGVGSLGVVLRKGDQGWLGNVRGWFMSATGFRNLERQINITSERMAIRLGSVGVGNHFSLQGIAAYARPSVSAPLRGVNV